MAVLFVIGAGASGMFDVPIEGAAIRPGGSTLTRRYDPAEGVTVFSLDVRKASSSGVYLAACPGVDVLRVDGPGGATVFEALSGTTVTFPTEAAGTYRVVVRGDMPGLDVGRSPVGCGDSAVPADPAGAPPGGAELGPSTRINKRPGP